MNFSLTGEGKGPDDPDPQLNEKRRNPSSPVRVNQAKRVRIAEDPDFVAERLPMCRQHNVAAQGWQGHTASTH